MPNQTQPIYGIDATGADTYVELIASPRDPANEFENKEYTNIIVFCATQDAIVSLDGGTTGQIYVKAGAEPMQLNNIKITAAVQGKNAGAGSNYANLVAIVW